MSWLQRNLACPLGIHLWELGYDYRDGRRMRRCVSCGVAQDWWFNRWATAYPTFFTRRDPGANDCE